MFKNEYFEEKNIKPFISEEKWNFTEEFNVSFSFCILTNKNKELKYFMNKNF
jgi:hypothetical protein